MVSTHLLSTFEFKFYWIIGTIYIEYDFVVAIIVIVFDKLHFNILKILRQYFIISLTDGYRIRFTPIVIITTKLII